MRYGAPDGAYPVTESVIVVEWFALLALPVSYALQERGGGVASAGRPLDAVRLRGRATGDRYGESLLRTTRRSNRV